MFAIAVLAALCKLCNCLFGSKSSHEEQECEAERPSAVVAPQHDLSSAEMPPFTGISPEPALAEGCAGNDHQAYMTSNPIGAVFSPGQPTSIHELLSSIGLLHYEATLAELGVTQVSHLQDVTLEDLREVMEPSEAQLLLASAEHSTTGVAL